MDQFEEIRKKNKRIVGVILIIPLLLLLGALALFFLYFFPIYTKLQDITKLEVQVMDDQDITEQEADAYISGLTGDEQVRYILADDAKYNSTLLTLYLKKEDYDKTIEYALSAISRADQPIYHYYLGFAYFEKEQFDEAKAEMIIVSSATVEGLAGDLDSEEGIRSAAGIKDDARAMIDIIGFHKFLAEDKTEDASLKMQKVGEYIEEFENDENIMQLELTDAEFNVAYFEYYLSQNNYKKILARAPQAIAANDQESYHYYLGMAYKWTDKYDLALQEMKASLQSSGLKRRGQLDNDLVARRKGYAGIFVANDYYNMGDYTSSAEFYRKAVFQGTEIEYPDDAEAQILNDLFEFYSVVISKKDFRSSILHNDDSELPIFIDTDQDGLSDNLENLLGTDLSERDTDGDGYEDEKELLFGHDPLLPSPDDTLTDKDYCDYFRKVLPYFTSIYNQ